jgi:hypothetical protein
MRRVLIVLAAFALVTMLIFVAMTVDLSLHGAYVTNSVERFPGAVAVVTIGSAITQIGLLVLLGATILGLALTGQRHQWGWLLLILVLFPVAVASMLSTAFVPNVALALLTLLSPLVLLLYSLRAHSARATAIAA